MPRQSGARESPVIKPPPMRDGSLMSPGTAGAPAVLRKRKAE
jgi:hypothetical protein